MLSTYTYFKLRVSFFTQVNTKFNKFSNSSYIYRSKWFKFKNSMFMIFVHELNRVISRKSHCSLSKVISSKWEEFSFTSYFICKKASSWSFHHCSYFIFYFHTLFFKNFIYFSFNITFDEFQLTNTNNKRNHNFWFNFYSLFFTLDSSFDYCSGLSIIYFRISNSKSTSSVS